MVHILLLFPRRGGSVRRVQFFRQLRQRPGQQLPFRLLHHPLLQDLRRVAVLHLHGFLQNDRTSVGHLVDEMNRCPSNLNAVFQRRFMDPQAIIALSAEGRD